MNNQEKIFADGIRFQGPGPKAPQYVKGKISVKVDAFIAFLQNHAQNGWVNLDLKESKKGVLYLELDTWQKGDISGSRRDRNQKIEDSRDDDGYLTETDLVETEIKNEELPF